MKKKMDTLTKMKLIFSGELIIIAIAFLVIGLLEITRVIRINNTVITIFTWVTLFGGFWMIIDFLWVLLSNKRRMNNCLLDKALLLPLGLCLIFFDLMALIGNIDKDLHYDFYRFFISSALLYIALAYTIEGIYHWFHPLPTILREIEEAEKQQKLAEQEAANIQENLKALDEEKKEDNKEA